MSVEVLLAFSLVTGLACFMPGPAAMLVMSVAAARDKRLTFHTMAGIAVGDAFYFGLSAVGLASVLLAMPRLYEVIRWLGAAYLLYLGVQLLRARGNPFRHDSAGSGTAGSALRCFAKGFGVELSNPKALVYFSALLPQFIDPAAPLAMQFLVFCLITVLLDYLAYTFYAAIAFGVARLSSPRLMLRIERVAGVVFVGVAVRLVAWE